MYKKRLKSFTLAEVLITLTIIGVIAAITIPNLTQKYQNYQLATKFKKTYSVLSEAVLSAAYESDMEKVGNNYGASNNSINDNFISTILDNLKVRSHCKNLTAGSTWTSCYNNKTNEVKALNGNAVTLTESLSGYGYGYAYNFLLEDGTFIAAQPSCTNIGINWYLNGKARILFTIDVNGLEQGPNKIGRDIFYIKMDGNGKLSPYGVGVADDCIKGGIGNTCAKKIIVDKNLDY